MTDPRKLLIEARKMLDHFLGDDSCMCQACLLCRSIDAALSEKVEPVPVEPEYVKFVRSEIAQGYKSHQKPMIEHIDTLTSALRVESATVETLTKTVESFQSALKVAQEDARDSALESLGYLRDKEKAEERNRRMVELMKEPCAYRWRNKNGPWVIEKRRELIPERFAVEVEPLYAMSAELLKEMEK